MRSYDLELKTIGWPVKIVKWSISTTGIEWAELQLLLAARKYFTRPILRKHKSVKNNYEVYQGKELVARAFILEVSAIFPTG